MRHSGLSSRAVEGTSRTTACCPSPVSRSSDALRAAGPSSPGRRCRAPARWWRRPAAAGRGSPAPWWTAPPPVDRAVGVDVQPDVEAADQGDEHGHHDGGADQPAVQRAERGPLLGPRPVHLGDGDVAARDRRQRADAGARAAAGRGPTAGRARCPAAGHRAGLAAVALGTRSGGTGPDCRWTAAGRRRWPARRAGPPGDRAGPGWPPRRPGPAAGWAGGRRSARAARWCRGRRPRCPRRAARWCPSGHGCRGDRPGRDRRGRDRTGRRGRRHRRRGGVGRRHRGCRRVRRAAPGARRVGRRAVRPRRASGPGAGRGGGARLRGRPRGCGGERHRPGRGNGVRAGSDTGPGSGNGVRAGAAARATGVGRAGGGLLGRGGGGGVVVFGRGGRGRGAGRRAGEEVRRSARRRPPVPATAASRERASRASTVSWESVVAPRARGGRGGIVGSPAPVLLRHRCPHPAVVVPRRSTWRSTGSASTPWSAPMAQSTG